MAFWNALENVHGGVALFTTWNLQLGPDLELFTALFLRQKPGDSPPSVPCPWQCGCHHQIVPQPNGTLFGICQCDPPRCDTYTVLPHELVTWELDWPKMGRAFCQAFNLDFKLVKLGLYNTNQIGSWSRDAIPALLTLPTSRHELLHTITLLIARLNRPFILFAPTDRYFGPTAKELLATLGSIFLPLSSHLTVKLPTSDLRSPSSTPTLHSSLSPHHFQDLSPSAPAPPDHDIASRVTLVLDELDGSSRRKHPSLASVFKLYYGQNLPVAQVAKKCRCSVGTIINRLKLIQTKTGATPDQLRRISPHFTQLHDSMSSAKSDYYRQKRHTL